MWRDADGTAFQRPEIPLAWNAKHHQPKDNADLART